MSLKNWRAAIDALERAILLDPNSSAAWYNYAVCFFFEEDYDSALSAAEMAFTLDPALEDVAESWIRIIKSGVLDVEYDQIIAAE